MNARLTLLLIALCPLAALAQSPDLRLFTGDQPAAPATTPAEVAQADAAPAEAAVTADASASEPGLEAPDTRAWLNLQAGGTAAQGAARPLPGEVADAVYQRYLQSFTHPIPEQFKRQSTSSEGQGGGASAK